MLFGNLQSPDISPEAIPFDDLMHQLNVDEIIPDPRVGLLDKHKLARKLKTLLKASDDLCAYIRKGPEGYRQSGTTIGSPYVENPVISIIFNVTPPQALPIIGTSSAESFALYKAIAEKIGYDGGLDTPVITNSYTVDMQNIRPSSSYTLRGPDAEILAHYDIWVSPTDRHNHIQGFDGRYWIPMVTRLTAGGKDGVVQYGVGMVQYGSAYLPVVSLD